KHALPFPLSSLEPRTGAYSLTCTASIRNGEQVVGSSLLTYTPAKPADIGGVTKMDMHSGMLLARPAIGENGPTREFFLLVHPISTFDNTSLLNEVLDEMQKNGLWLTYDLRLTYTSVTEQVNQIKSRPNLLLWYSADEPDGTHDPLNATSLAQSLITSLDGSDGNGGAGYHPVSLVLNCENFFWSEYASDADVWVVEAILGISHGGLGRRRFSLGTTLLKTSLPAFLTPGVVSWNDPTPDDIKTSASGLALALTSGPSNMSAFILNPSSTFKQVTTSSGIDTGLWTLDGKTLLLAATLEAAELGLGLKGFGNGLTEVFCSGDCSIGDESVVLGSVDSVSEHETFVLNY
ncbi:hypothetical protein BT96DRAFT_1085985, partial [Gymnopus androsaceus JB14]